MANLQSNIHNLQSILTTINNLPEQSIEKKGYKLTLRLDVGGQYPDITINGQLLEEYGDASYNTDRFSIILTNIVKVNIISNIPNYESINMTLLADDVLYINNYDYIEGKFLNIEVETGNSYNVCILGDALFTELSEGVFSSSKDGFSSVEFDQKISAGVIYGPDSSPNEEFIRFYPGDTWGSYLFGLNNTLPFSGLAPNGGFFVDSTGNIQYYGVSMAYLVIAGTDTPVNVFDPIEETNYEAVYSTAGFEG